MFQNSSSSLTESPPLAEYTHAREVRLVDTDATGIAHFASYTRMMEEAEYAFLRSRGLSVILMDDRGTMGFPRVRCEVEVERPLFLGEHVSVLVQLTKTDGKRVVYQFHILDADGEIAVRGNFVVALCRFPNGKMPYAILFPPGLAEQLTAPVGN